MAQKIIMTGEEREALDPILQAEYVAVEGEEDRFVFDGITVDGWAVEDVAGLRRTVETTRGERDGFKADLKTFEGLDVTEYQRLMAKKKEIDEWDPTNDDAFKTRLEEANATWQTKYDTDLGAEKKRGDESDVKYKMHLRTSAAIEALSKHAPKGVTVLLPHLLNKLGVYENENGKEVVWVVGKDGRPKITQKAGQQGNMTPEELVLAMKELEEFAPNFPGTGASGGGATGGGTGKGTVKVDPNLSAVERLKQARRAERAAN